MLDKPIRYVELSDEVARSGMLTAGMPDFYADTLLDLNRAYREGAGSAVTTTVAELTGREATSFERFVRDYVDQFR